MTQDLSSLNYTGMLRMKCLTESDELPDGFQWERGEHRPQGASLKLLALVARNGLAGVA